MLSTSAKFSLLAQKLLSKLKKKIKNVGQDLIFFKLGKTFLFHTEACFAEIFETKLGDII